MNYDIIGDIHGHADALEKLLQKLGYKLNKGIYSHIENRQVVFIGDFIDRGPKIRETLHIVKNMCDNGSAFAIMGNHEFNAVCFHEKDKKKGGYYRKHSFTEINQHYETLKQFKDFKDEWKIFLTWFKELPLFLEFDDFNVVHACWVESHINWLKENYSGELTIDFLEKATVEGNKEYEVIEETLKGIELQLPQGEFFYDKDGVFRDRCRLMWWMPDSKRENYSDVLMLCPPTFGSQKINDQSMFSYNSDKTVFFGHYWFKANPEIENEKAICLDYSVAKNGKLVAFKSEYLNNDKDINQGFIF